MCDNHADDKEQTFHLMMKRNSSSSSSKSKREMMAENKSEGLHISRRGGESIGKEKGDDGGIVNNH